MGGEDRRSGQLFSYINLEARVPSKHPLRLIRVLADDALRTLSPQFDAIYAHGGRPSIPPEWLLRALLLQTIYSLRSERQLMEHLDHNLLYRWFVGLSADDPVWDVTVFTRNRDRLLEAGIAKGFLDALLAQPKVAALLSDEHFSVDGTILEAAASMKSFVAKPAPAAGEAAPQTGSPAEATDARPDAAPPVVATTGQADPAAEAAAPNKRGRNAECDFHGEKRSNETHASTTDTDARLFRKGKGKEAKLCHMGHALMENRNGLVVDATVTVATGTAERDAALAMLDRAVVKPASPASAPEQTAETAVAAAVTSMAEPIGPTDAAVTPAPVAAPQPEAGAEIAETAAADGSTGDRPSPGGVTLGADKAYDTKGFVGELDSRKVAPHIARNTKNRRSAVPDEVAATPGDATSIRVRKRIEEVFGWMKTVGAMRKLRHRGTALVGWMFTLSAAAYNLVRLSRLIPAAA